MIRGTETGFIYLDAIISGIERGKLYSIIGHDICRKEELMDSIYDYISKTSDKKIAYIDLIRKKENVYNSFEMDCFNEICKNNDIVFVNFLQAITVDGCYNSRSDELDFILREMKRNTLENDVAIIISADCSRNVYPREYDVVDYKRIMSISNCVLSCTMDLENKKLKVEVLKGKNFDKDYCIVGFDDFCICYIRNLNKFANIEDYKTFDERIY